MRRRQAPKRAIEPDRVYGSVVVAKCINHVMQGGEKATAEKIVYGAMQKAGEQLKQDPLEVFESAMQNVSPSLEVVSRRVGGATYQVPREVRAERRTQLALRWMIGAAKGQRPRRSMQEAFAKELVQAAQGEGSAVKKKDNMHRMAEANRAFAHFAR